MSSRTFSFRIFRVALLFICQGTSKADSCVKVISESLLSGNCFHTGRHCATALSEQLRCELALLTSQVCFAFVAVSLRRNSDIISCVSVCVNTFLRFFIFVFLLRKTSLPSRRISYQLFQTVEFDYSTCPKFLSTNIYMKYRLFLQVRAKNLEAPTLALPGLLVAKRRKRDLNPRAA